MLSECFWREDDGIAEAERLQIRSDGVEIAHRKSDQTFGVEVARHDAGDVFGGDALDAWNELFEVIVGQVVEGELERPAPDLFAGLEAAGVPARERRDAELELGRRDRARTANAGNFSQRLLDRIGGAAGLHADLEKERSRAAAEFERRARAVREPLVLAQIQIDAADELSAEDRVGDD